MTANKAAIRWCAVYTRKSSEEGLEQQFNSLHAQREAAEAYIKSQRHEGWRLLAEKYDDGGYSGGNLERPALKRLTADIRAGKVQTVVVYKVDRLTRSLSDFAKLIELFEARGVTFVSVTQAFNTTTSMGRLMLNVLLSFAQFEREVTGERIRDKIAAAKKKVCGWVARRQSVMNSKAKSSWSIEPKRRSYDTSSAATWPSNRWPSCAGSLRRRATAPSRSPAERGGPMAASRLPGGICTGSCKIASTGGR